MLSTAGSTAAVALLALGLGTAGIAGEALAERGACREEIRELCPDATDRRQIGACVRERLDDLSPACAERLARVREKRRERRRACSEDVAALCGDVEPGTGGARRCLRENLDQLSGACREALDRRRGNRQP
jgi:hypothetical protein